MADPNDEIQRRTSLVIQTLPILLIPIGVGLISIFLLRFTVGDPPIAAGVDLPSPLPIILMLVVFFSALIVLVRLRRPTISALGLIGVWTIATVGAILQRGVSSNMVALLIIPICVAGLLFDAVASISLAALATLLVLSMAWLEVRTIRITEVTAFPPPELAPVSAAMIWISLFWIMATLTSILSNSLHRALRESRRRAAELRELSDELEARVQAQAAQLVDQAQARAVIEERARLAREIHDTIAQGLAGVAVQIGAARQGIALLPDDADPQLREALDENLTIAERATRETLSEARRSVWNLRTPLLDRAGLHEALQQIAAHAALPTEVQITGEPWPLGHDAEAALLRVAQESLANTAKHAQARRATLRLSYGADSLTFQVGDDGRGFPPALLDQRPAPTPAGGFGLVGMEERISALGGRLALENDGGACVTVTLPR